MTLATCSECKKPVSTKAPACPHCGNPISREDAARAESGAGGGRLVLAGLFVAAVIVIAVQAARAHGVTPATAAPAVPSEAVLQARAAVACQTAVENRLTSPSTADFSWDVAYKRVKKGAVVGGVVDAQNSFGGTLRRHYTCMLAQTDSVAGEWTVLKTSIDR